MAGLIVLLFVFLMMFSVNFRLVVLHPVKFLKYLISDPYFYFHDHKYKKYEGGLLNCYAAHFGGGKTLSVVHYVRLLYNEYNNQWIYDRKKKRWVLQKIHIISNVDLLDVPYEKLSSL